MTLKQWLSEQRRPEMCGINARAHLKRLGATHMRGDVTCARNAVDFAVRQLCAALAGTPVEPRRVTEAERAKLQAAR